MKIANKIMVGASAMSAIMAMAAIPAFAQTSLNVNANVGGALPVRADVSANAGWHGDKPMNRVMAAGIFGAVKAVNGTVLSVESRGFKKDAASTTYSVDASSAVVMKNNATSTLSSVQVNDMIFAEGVVTGSSVKATVIRDGALMRGQKTDKDGNDDKNKNPMIKGNGQPVVAGTVSAVNGSTLSITTSSNTSYTIDASNATTSPVSSIKVGDYIVVQGTVNGTAVVAATVMDQKAPPASGSGKSGEGFMGAIGSFFKHLFGF